MTPEQEAYQSRNVVKPANIKQWVTFQFTHPDWSVPLNFVAIEDWKAVEFDSDFYTFQGVTYKPVSMSYKLPNESKTENGKASLTFPRAASEVKKRMKEITAANSDKPRAAVIRIYQEGITLPVRVFSGNIAKDYPKISKSDVSIQISSYNPNVLTSSPERIITIERYPELRRS
tara:strand:- start:2293 stop:2814 length:522 start_codon:yes stop_codon:yes gene_type:complete